jgi:hypothetical protein
MKLARDALYKRLYNKPWNLKPFKRIGWDGLAMEIVSSMRLEGLAATYDREIRIIRKWAPPMLACEVVGARELRALQHALEVLGKYFEGGERYVQELSPVIDGLLTAMNLTKKQFRAASKSVHGILLLALIKEAEMCTDQRSLRDTLAQIEPWIDNLISSQAKPGYIGRYAAACARVIGATLADVVGGNIDGPVMTWLLVTLAHERLIALQEGAQPGRTTPADLVLMVAAARLLEGDESLQKTLGPSWTRLLEAALGLQGNAWREAASPATMPY